MPAEWPPWDELARRYGLTLRLQGGQLRGVCPLHGGTNPTSFVVDPERGLFYCHACGQGGGLQTFRLLMEGGPVSGLGAVRLQERVGVRKGPPCHRELERLANGRLRALAGLLEVDPIYPRDQRHPYFRSRGLSPRTVAAFNAGVYEGPGPFHRRAVFPVWTPEGRLVGHIGRAIDPSSSPRYLCERGFRKAALLFNEAWRPKETVNVTFKVTSGTSTAASDIPTVDEVVVVEGVFDAAAVVEAGFPHVVALLGAVPSDFQLAALSRYRRVVAVLDADEAGRRGADRLRRALGRTVTVMDLGRGDPASVGPDTLVAKIPPVTTVTTL